MIDAYLRILTAKLNQARATLLEQLAAGAAPDYPTYRQMVGFVLGIDETLKLSQDLRNTFLQQEDDEDGSADT